MFLKGSQHFKAGIHWKAAFLVPKAALARVYKTA